MSLLQHRSREERPWGSFERFTLNENATVKTITLKPGARFSLQHHLHRTEFWHVLSGTGTARIGDEEHEAKKGDEFEIPCGSTHRMTAGTEGITFLEIALGNFDEDDIVRTEDDYGRATDAS